MSVPWPTLLLALVCGAALQRALLWPVLRWPERWAWQGENYQGRRIPTSTGLLLALPAGVALLTAGLVSGAESGRLLSPLGAVLVLFALLGLQDDLAKETAPKGLLGHLRATFARRRPTSGAAKAFGGALVGVWASAGLQGHLGWEALLGGAVVALSANGLNALDRRPGRAGKAFLVLCTPLVVLALLHRPALATALLGLAAAVVAYLPADLGRRVMMGDAGANPLGAALGFVAVALTGSATQVVLAALLLAFTLACDRFPLTALIERVPALAWLDRLGAKHDSAGATDCEHPA